MSGYDPHTLMLRETIAGLRVGRPRSYEELSILPLLSTSDCRGEYVLLEEALSLGALTIAEIGDCGAVPYLTAANTGPRPVLIFGGEELAGATQNCVCSATILVGVGKSVLPVSYVESGCWSRGSAAFAAGVSAAYTGGAHHEARARPQNSAPADHLKTRSRDLNDYLEALSFADNVLENAVGAMVFFGGSFVCGDFLRPAARFARLYPKLLLGYALEALVFANKRDFFVQSGLDDLLTSDLDPCVDFDSEAAALCLLAELRDAAVQVQSAVNLGEDVRLETRSLSGVGLAWNEELMQVSLCPRKAA